MNQINQNQLNTRKDGELTYYSILKTSKSLKNSFTPTLLNPKILQIALPHERKELLNKPASRPIE